VAALLISDIELLPLELNGVTEPLRGSVQFVLLDAGPYLLGDPRDVVASGQDFLVAGQHDRHVPSHRFKVAADLTVLLHLDDTGLDNFSQITVHRDDLVLKAIIAKPPAATAKPSTLSATHTCTRSAESTAFRDLPGYPGCNQDTPMHYAARRRRGEPISTAFAESVVNEIIARRMNERQPMLWNRADGAVLPRPPHHLAERPPGGTTSAIAFPAPTHQQ
jgi:hypothetical protein